MFANKNDVKNSRWHANERKFYGKFHHVVDSLRWKKNDSLFLDFGHESRKLKHGLFDDGINMFDNLSTKCTSWIVLLIFTTYLCGFAYMLKFIVIT